MLTGIGYVSEQVAKVRDRSDSGACFNSSLLPYLKRTSGIEELIPWLYLPGISTGNYQGTRTALLGGQTKCLSANTVSRLKKQRYDEHAEWQKRD